MPDGSSTNRSDGECAGGAPPIGIVGGRNRRFCAKACRMSVRGAPGAAARDGDRSRACAPPRASSESVGGGDEPLDRRIDMRAERGDVLAVRPRDGARAGPRVTRTGGHIIRVEEISEPLVEYAVAGKPRDQQELLEEPGRMRAMPFGRAGIGHRLHHLVLGAERRGAAFGLRAARCGRRRARRCGDRRRSLPALRYSLHHGCDEGRRVAGTMPNPGLEKSRSVDGKPIWRIDSSMHYT